MHRAPQYGLSLEHASRDAVRRGRSKREFVDQARSDRSPVTDVEVLSVARSSEAASGRFTPPTPLPLSDQLKKLYRTARLLPLLICRLSPPKSRYCARIRKILSKRPRGHLGVYDQLPVILLLAGADLECVPCSFPRGPLK